MKKSNKLFFWIICICFFYSASISSDNFRTNNFNNHGSVGLVNMPTARFFNESSFGFTFYDGNPDQKITMTSNPFDWLEASFFYTNIQGKPEPGLDSDYKDKGFNVKIRLKEEGILPAIAIGINDAAGTGFYSSEYVVASYGVQNIDFHFGLGWGSLNGAMDFKNPLGLLDDRFYERPFETQDAGGQFQPSRYFSDQRVSPFFGLSYFLNDKFLLKIERDTTLTPGKVGYSQTDSDISIGFDFINNENFNFGISFERNDALSMRFVYKMNASESKKTPNYKKANFDKDDSQITKFIKNLETNGIGVNKVIDQPEKIGIEITQFAFPNLDAIEEIIYSAQRDSNLDKEALINYKIADLDAITEFDSKFVSEGNILYQREKSRGFNTDTSVTVRPFIAARESFLKVAVLLENNSEYIFSDNLFFSSNLKYSLFDNFNDLVIPEEGVVVEKVRSDIKDYLRNFNKGIVIGRAQLDYFKTIKRNHHIMLTGGILEEMFNGYGFEYLYFKNSSNHAFGFELFDVFKRDYQLQFGMLDYQTVTGHFNYYYRNYGKIPFDLKTSYGKYLAGDIGMTLELSRSFSNGVKFGVFASFTDVSTEDFGEGSFDKGIFFNIPIFGNMVNYSWRPLTKDPGQKLIRKNNLHDLLVKFRPIN